MIQELISMTLIAVMNLKKLIDKLSGNCSFNKSVGSLILRNVKKSLVFVEFTWEKHLVKNAMMQIEILTKHMVLVIWMTKMILKWSVQPSSLCQQVEPKVFTITLTTEGYKDQWQNLSKWCFDENRRLHDCFRWSLLKKTPVILFKKSWFILFFPLFY